MAAQQLTKSSFIAAQHKLSALFSLTDKTLIRAWLKDRMIRQADDAAMHRVSKELKTAWLALLKNDHLRHWFYVRRIFSIAAFSSNYAGKIFVINLLVMLNADKISQHFHLSQFIIWLVVVQGLIFALYAANLIISALYISADPVSHSQPPTHLLLKWLSLLPLDKAEFVLALWKIIGLPKTMTQWCASLGYGMYLGDDVKNQELMLVRRFSRTTNGQLLLNKNNSILMLPRLNCPSPDLPFINFLITYSGQSSNLDADAVTHQAWQALYSAWLTLLFKQQDARSFVRPPKQYGLTRL